MSKIFERQSLTIAADNFIRKPPKFAIFFSNDRVSESQMATNRSLLDLAIQKAHQGFAKEKNYSIMLQAFELFALCDSYPIFSELLSQRKQASQSLPARVKCLNTVFNLLDAHVFAKIGDIEQECKAILAFVKEAYEQLSTNQLAKLVTHVFYRSLFGLMIYQYKESHGGVRIPLSMYQMIEPGQNEAQTIKLPQIFVKAGTFAHLKLSMQWMGNLLNALRDGEEKLSHEHLFYTGYEMADCTVRNLNSTQVFELREHIANLIVFTNSPTTANELKKYHDFFEQLRQIQYTKDSNSAKKCVNSCSQHASPVKYVTVGLTDPKGIAQRYKNHICKKIDDELNIAAEVETEALDSRKNAAAKIKDYWLGKREQIIETKVLQKTIKQAEKEQAEAARKKEQTEAGLPPQAEFKSPFKYRNTIQNYASKPFNFARACCPNMVGVMHDSDSLIKKMTGILGSDLIKGALDQKLILEQMKELTSLRSSTLSCMSGLSQDSRSKVGNMRNLIDKMTTKVKAVDKMLAEWISRQTSDLANIERSKHRYIKLEKWNTVIQQRRTRKLKLQHLKRNLAAKVAKK